MTDAVAATRKLLSWYDRHKRPLPWRESRDPYRVWLSEIMLQQTRVETVLPYFERFTARFPTVADLAGAPEEEVLALWSGLGYYRRARQLHRAACQVAAAGDFPRTLEGLLGLPGIGPYTAAAVASICFDLPVPVLDGNVERVIARRLAWREDAKSSRSRQRLLREAEELLDARRPGDSNQALMELGATLCSPRRPACPRCPLREGCAARAGDPEELPVKRRRRTLVKLRLAMVVVRREEHVLLFRRGQDDDLLAGFWELPWSELPAPGQPEPRQLADALAGRYGGSWRLGASRGSVRHGVTFRDLEIQVFVGQVAGEGVGEGPEAGWFDAHQRQGLPLSSLVGKVLDKAIPRDGDGG